MGTFLLLTYPNHRGTDTPVRPSPGPHTAVCRRVPGKNFWGRGQEKLQHWWVAVIGPWERGRFSLNSCGFKARQREDWIWTKTTVLILGEVLGKIPKWL